MTYTLFFLLGIPFWLIASTRVFRTPSKRPRLKMAWAAMAFFAPVVIFGLASIASVVIHQQLGETAAQGALTPLARGFGYFLVPVQLFAFFSPFAVAAVFDSRYAAPQGPTASR